MSGANARPIGRSHQEMSGANASPTRSARAIARSLKKGRSHQETIYFDNAATSWPKPPAVLAALEDYFGDAGGNPGRSGHRMSVAAARIVESARELLAELFNAKDPSRIVFTQNATHALNLALYGLVHPGDHVVTTSVEHNSVMRPLRHLETLDVEVTVVACTPDGTPDLHGLRLALRP